MDSRLLKIDASIVTLRAAEVSDVPFIFELRRLERSNFMYPISPEIRLQYDYFQKYIERYIAGEEIYFIIFDKIMGSYNGLLRLTRINETSGFGFESLIMKLASTPGAAIDAIAAVYAIGFKYLGREICGPFLVPKENSRVIKLHHAMGVARQIDEDQQFLHFSVTRDDYLSGEGRLTRMGFGNIDY